MVPIDKVKDIIEKYETLEKELSSGSVEPKFYANKSKEYSNLIKIDKNYAFKVIWENMLKYNSSRNFKKKLKKYFKFFFFSKAKDAHIS